MNRRWVNINTTVNDHKMCRELLPMENDEDRFHRPQIVSRTALEKLTQVWIRELAMDRQNVGKFVLLRVLEEGYSRADYSWLKMMEDQVGDTIGLSLYNYPTDHAIPRGTFVVIKEPYVRFKMGLLFIRCDCPTDLVVLSTYHPWRHKAESAVWKNRCNFEDPVAFYPVPRSSGEWRARGNDLYSLNKMDLAREAYFLSHKMCGMNDLNIMPIYLNQLQVHLNLGYYEWVIEHAKKLPDEYKLLYGVGKAYYSLRKYEDALSTFWGAIELFERMGILELEFYKDQVDEAWNILKRAEARVKETRGEFSIEDIKYESEEKPCQEIDCADFCVPMKRKESLGKGLVLETRVEKDDVVMISKAWAAAFRNERDIQKDATEVENLEIKSKVDDDNILRAKVVSKLTNLVFKNPESFGSMLFKLYAGASNNESIQLFCDSEGVQKEPICDVNRINNIYVSNGFTILRNVCNTKIGSGLFYLPSFLNHSSKPNVDYKFYNDVMVVSALEDIADGKELTINRVHLDLNYQNYFKKRDFVRTCLNVQNNFIRNGSFHNYGFKRGEKWKLF